MNFSVLLIAFCDINAILHGSTITHGRTGKFSVCMLISFEAFKIKSQNMYQCLSSRPSTIFCISQKCSFLFEVAIGMFMHRTISYCVGWTDFNRIQFYDIFLGAENVINWHRKTVWFLDCHQENYLLILKGIFLISEMFSCRYNALFPSQHTV